MIRAIIFDYGNVLARFDHAIFFRNIAAYSSLSVGELRAIAGRNREILVEYESGRLSSGEFIRRVTEACSLSITTQQFLDAFNNIFHRIPETAELVRRLKPHYALGLLSNTNELHHKAEIERSDVFSLFDAVTLSYRVGAMKPSSALFHDMLARLRLPSSDCVYIDDIAEYADAARALGFRAIHFTTHATLLESLRSFGVMV